ncbi:MAG TPA: sialidase family protein [Thermoanaerobaculia bacterium]|nr:sialidase family protein [Thermoanaerobaculia bacterium]
MTRTLALVLLISLSAFAALAQDVQVNVTDHTSGTKGDGTTQSETNHAVTPNGVFVAFNDSSLFGLEGTLAASRMGWRSSADGGQTFTGGGMFLYPNDVDCWGDPAVVADSSGFVYIVGLVENFAGIAIARTTGTMAPYNLQQATIVPPPPNGDFDKELMAIDRTGGQFNNRIYVAVRNLTGEKVWEAHTTSLNPITFSNWQAISQGGTIIRGSQPVVAPNGDVYVIWRRGDVLEIVRSTDGGGAWDNPDPNDAATAKAIFTIINKSPVALSAFNGGSIKVIAMPQMAIDGTAVGSPTRGNLYVVFHADPDEGGADRSDVFFTRSTNNGVTWSKPRSIASGLAATIGRDLTTNDNFIPSIAVSPVNGHIYITFWDRREDAANLKGRLFRALSTDGGQTFNVIPFATSTFTPVGGFKVGGSDYWSEYNWTTANANGIQFTWSDSRNLCAPPMNAMAPCTPPGRPDQDTYFRKAANLSGVDLFIQPWGAVTGEGPKWQTSYIFAVDANDVKVNAKKGIVNHLRARVRNLGNAASSNATVRFKYAPWFAGLNDAMMKEIGTMKASFSAAGGGSDDKTIPIDWDLTNLADTNGGKWPKPIGDFEHFCVKVSVEPLSDVNLSNNVAQSNFFDVATAAAPAAPMDFIIAGPDPKEFGGRPVFAQIVVDKLPPRFGARVTIDGVSNPARGFRIMPDELRLAKVTFTAPAGFSGPEDVVADINLLLDGKPNGGISARLYDSPRDREPRDTLGRTTAPYWENVRVETPEQIRGDAGVQYVPPPPRTIPRKVRFRETFALSYDEAFRIVRSVLTGMKLGPELANPERGLFNTTSKRVPREQLARLIESTEPRPQADGYYWMSVWLQPRGERETEIGVDAFIASEDVEAPGGRRRRSNGTVEKSVLEAIRRAVGGR